MPSPFPGMDPYLESSDLWPDFHHELISKIRETLNPLILPRYVARIETRVHISDDDAVLIDREIEEAYLTIKDRTSDAPVTVIEVTSPTNKIRGSQGRRSFMEKKSAVIASNLHWVEIDLLRSGSSSVALPLKPSDYRIIVSRGEDRYRARCWPVGVRQELPVIAIPLREKNEEVLIALSAVFDATYDSGAYDATIDYSKPPDPLLNDGDAKWANKELREKGLR